MPGLNWQCFYFAVTPLSVLLFCCHHLWGGVSCMGPLRELSSKIKVNFCSLRVLQCNLASPLTLITEQDMEQFTEQTEQISSPSLSVQFKWISKQSSNSLQKQLSYCFLKDSQEIHFSLDPQQEGAGPQLLGGYTQNKTQSKFQNDPTWSAW